jgi:hypothetical protein
MHRVAWFSFKQLPI